MSLYLTCTLCPEILSALSVPPTAWSGGCLMGLQLVGKVSEPLCMEAGGIASCSEPISDCTPYLSKARPPLTISTEHVLDESHQTLLFQAYVPRILADTFTYYFFKSLWSLSLSHFSEFAKGRLSQSVFHKTLAIQMLRLEKKYFRVQHVWKKMHKSPSCIFPVHMNPTVKKLIYLILTRHFPHFDLSVPM